MSILLNNRTIQVLIAYILLVSPVIALNKPDLLVSVSCEASANLGKLTNQRNGNYPELRATIIYSNRPYSDPPLGNTGDYRVIKLNPGDLATQYHMGVGNNNSFAAITPIYNINNTTFFPLNKINDSYTTLSGQINDDSMLSVVMHYGGGYNLGAISQILDPAYLNGSNKLHVHIHNLGKTASRRKIPYFDVVVTSGYKGAISKYSKADLVQQSALGYCYVRSYSY